MGVEVGGGVGESAACTNMPKGKTWPYIIYRTKLVHIIKLNDERNAAISTMLL